MGNYMNKFFPRNNETRNDDENEKEEIRDNCTDGIMENDCVHTPPIIPKVLPTDPRSATSGITRTPIAVQYGTPVINKRQLTAVPKYLQTKPYLETDIDTIMCLTPKKRSPRALIETKKLHVSNLEEKYKEALLKPVAHNTNKREPMTEIEKDRYDVLGLDPRSPAADFDRTPLLKPRSLERLRARSQETLHRQGSYEADQSCPSSYSYCEISSPFDVTEVQALPDLASCVLKSLNLDDVNDSGKSIEHSGRATGAESRSENEKREPGDQEFQTSGRNARDGKDVQEETFEAAGTRGDDNNLIKVWRDSSVSEKSETGDVEIARVKDDPQVAEDRAVITFDENGTVRIESSAKPAKSDKSRPDATGKRNSKTEAKDEKKIFAEKNSNGSATTARTPLGNRSNAHEQMQTARNSRQTFRSKGVKPITLQENTPPGKRPVPKSKVTQWDLNTTFII